ncbi:MAG: type II toxin-antitoxin system VapC family toxin [Verrucomicrobiota bacterium]
MTDRTYVLVDSNIILDLSGNDLQWREWSKTTLGLIEIPFVNSVVFSELCYFESSPEAVIDLLANLDIGYQDLDKTALYLASQAYRYYRKRGGIKTSPLPDFFIGAHAASLGIPILTRDVARYRSYFPSVELICP